MNGPVWACPTQSNQSVSNKMRRSNAKKHKHKNAQKHFPWSNFVITFPYSHCSRILWPFLALVSCLFPRPPMSQPTPTPRLNNNKLFSRISQRTEANNNHFCWRATGNAHAPIFGQAFFLPVGNFAHSAFSHGIMQIWFYPLKTNFCPLKCCLIGNLWGWKHLKKGENGKFLRFLFFLFYGFLCGLLLNVVLFEAPSPVLLPSSGLEQEIGLQNIFIFAIGKFWYKREMISREKRTRRSWCIGLQWKPCDGGHCQLLLLFHMKLAKASTAKCPFFQCCFMLFLSFIWQHLKRTFMLQPKHLHIF